MAPRFTGDGVYRANDLAAIQLFFSGVPFSTEFNEFQRADGAPYVDRGDGVLDATDVALMRRYIAFLADAQQAGGPTVPNPAPPPLFEGESVVEAANGRAMRVVAGDAKAGEQVTVSIEMDGLGDETIASFTLNFDAAVLGNPIVSLGKDAPDGTSLITNLTNIAGGEIGLLIDANDGFGASRYGRRIVTVTFDIAKDVEIGKDAKALATPIWFSGSLVAIAVSDAEAHFLATRYERSIVRIGMDNSQPMEERGQARLPDCELLSCFDLSQLYPYSRSMSEIK